MKWLIILGLWIPYICISKMSFHLWETKQNNRQPNPSTVCMSWSISWEDKARKAIAWGITASSDTVAGSSFATVHSCFCSLLCWLLCWTVSTLWLMVKFILWSRHFDIFHLYSNHFKEKKRDLNWPLYFCNQEQDAPVLSSNWPIMYIWEMSHGQNLSK